MSIKEQVNEHMDVFLRKKMYEQEVNRVIFTYPSLQDYGIHNKIAGVNISNARVKHGVQLIVEGIDPGKVFDSAWDCVACYGFPQVLDGDLDLVMRLNREYRIATRSY